MWLKIDDPDKSWELLHAGLLWFKSRDASPPNEFYHYFHPECSQSWESCRHLWGAEDQDFYWDSKYVLLEE